jgi:alpha-galactosidase
MKPGLWISLAAAQPGSEPLTDHPEWFVRDEKGRITNLHEEINYAITRDNQPYTACMGTEWKAYIKEKILFCIKEYGLAYAKLDFAVVCSAYQFNEDRTGCHATDHPYHKDREESYYVLYQRVMELLDELHAEAPDLFIDCTFATAGKLQLMDYGIAQYAEGNWLSNVQHTSPLGPLRVRNLAWGRTPALPATSLVIGNLTLDHPLRLLCLQSLAGTLPIVLGDPRRLSSEERKEMKDWSDWLRGVEQRHGYSEFRQDLPGYGEPVEGAWDGFARINTETKSGGLVGIFRQGAAEERRIVTIPYLDADTRYTIKAAPNGKVIAKMTGAELQQKGFKTTLKALYQGMLYEICGD